MAMNALQVTDVSLRRELWQTMRSPVAAQAGEASKRVLRRSDVKSTVAERQLLELLLSDHQVRHEMLGRLEKSDYEFLATGTIFQAVVDLDAEGKQPDLEALTEKLGDDLDARQLVPALLIGETQWEEGENAPSFKVLAEGVWTRYGW